MNSGRNRNLFMKIFLIIGLFVCFDFWSDAQEKRNKKAKGF